MRIVFVLVFVLFSGTVEAATTYYVSKSGKAGASCLVAAPCLTIAEGTAKLSGGDTLQISAGTYAENIGYNMLPSGLSDTQRTIVQAAPGNVVWLTGFDGNQISIWIGGSTPRQYITIDGINVDGKAGAGALFYINDPNTSSITFQNAEVMNSVSAGSVACVGALQGTGHKLINLKVHGCRATSTPAEHGIYISDGGGNHIVERNEVYDVANIGIQQFHQYSNNSTFRYNYVHDVSGPGILVQHGSNTNVYGNVIARAGTTGIRVLSEGNGDGIYNNTIFGSAGCISLEQGVSSVIVQNNLCLSNSNNTVNIIDANGQTVSNNTSSTNNAATVVSVTFPNGDSTGAKLVKGSPAIDAGTALASQFATDLAGLTRGAGGTAWDTGAYEFSAGTGSVVTVTIQNPTPPAATVSATPLSPFNGTAVTK